VRGSSAGVRSLLPVAIDSVSENTVRYVGHRDSVLWAKIAEVGRDHVQVIIGRQCLASFAFCQHFNGFAFVEDQIAIF